MVRVRWLVLILAAALLQGGCVSRTRSAAARTEAMRAAAKAALMGYLEGRRDTDMQRAYSHLSADSQALYTQTEFNTYYGQFPVFAWQRIGEVTLVAEDWARVVVFGISSETRDGQRQELPDFAYYIRREEDRWGVAVVNPALGKLQSTTDAQAMLGAAGPLLKANPYSSRIHKELYYAHLLAGDAPQAEAQLRTLYNVSSPSDLATLQVLWSQLFLVTDRPDEAIKASRTAIELAQAYPETYTASWSSVALTNQAKAHLMLGQMDQARVALSQAVALDGANSDARALLMEIGQSRG